MLHLQCTPRMFNLHLNSYAQWNSAPPQNTPLFFTHSTPQKSLFCKCLYLIEPSDDCAVFFSQPFHRERAFYPSQPTKKTLFCVACLRWPFQRATHFQRFMSLIYHLSFKAELYGRTIDILTFLKGIYDRSRHNWRNRPCLLFFSEANLQRCVCDWQGIPTDRTGDKLRLYWKQVSRCDDRGLSERNWVMRTLTKWTILVCNM